MISLRWSETDDSTEWDGFVHESGGSIFHTWSWRRVLESTGHRPLYLACRDGKGRIVAVCPFFYRKTGRRLQYLESLPSSPIGGPVIDGEPGDIPEIIGAMSRSVTPSIRNPVVSLQFRVHQQAIIQPLLGAGMRHDASQGLSILSLVSKSREYIWNKEFGKHDRQAVKYYDDRGASFTFAESESDFIEYQNLHHETMSRVGERSRPREFFSRMQSNLGEKFKVGLITFEGKLIAGFAMICDPRSSTVYLGLNIGYTRVRNIHSSMLYLNWKIVKWASENDFRVINFGITEADHNDPNHRMKEKFGSEFVPLYRFILPTSRMTYSVAETIDRKIGSLRRSLSASESQPHPSDKK